MIFSHRSHIKHSIIQSFNHARGVEPRHAPQARMHDPVRTDVPARRMDGRVEHLLTASVPYSSRQFKSERKLASVISS